MSECSSCGAQIIWAVSEEGKPMPVDQAVPRQGNLLLFRRNGKVVAAVACPALREKHPEGPWRISHFATCPDAKKFRKAK